MDPATHLLATALLLGREPMTLWAGLAPDLAFYATYPWWWALRGRRTAAKDGTGEALPMPPAWIQQAHFCTHSLLVLGLLAWLWRARPQRRRQLLTPWLLHILLDIPSHSRARMAPRLLWPLSDWAFDGVSWSDTLHSLLSERKR